MKRGSALALVLALALALAGCLRAFGPDVRAKGPHAALSSTSDPATCMGCHESEADALARMKTQPRVEGMPDGAPLVPDWMVTDKHPCVTCHVVRGTDAR